MKEFAALRATCSYLTDNRQGTKKCFVNIKLKSEDYKHFLEETEFENKLNNLKKIVLKWIIIKKILNNS